MAIQQLTAVQKKMLNNMCISAQEVHMGDLLFNLISVANSGGSGLVSVATTDVAGIVRASTEVVVDAEGVMSIGVIGQNKVDGLTEDISSIKEDIQSIMETGVSATVVERIDTVESSVSDIERNLTTVENNQVWGDFSSVS